MNRLVGSAVTLISIPAQLLKDAKLKNNGKLIPSQVQFKSKARAAAAAEYIELTYKVLGGGDRGFQPACHDSFHGERWTLLIAPTGGGKSLIQVFNAAREILESGYKQKQVFIVPQLNIGVGFTGLRHERIMLGGTVYNWEVSVDCCSDSRNSVERIREFLLKPVSCKSHIASGTIGGCTAVVSYSAILAAWSKMTKTEQRRAIRNTSFRPDEVHHVAGVDESGAAANQLGEFCKQILDLDGSLHLTTATFFRGDQSLILDRSYLKRFKVFHVQFMDHWNTLGLNGLDFTYHCYTNGADVLNQVAETIRSEPKERPLVIVPSDGQGFFKKSDKWKWVKKLVKSIEAVHGKGNVLDLVSLDRQDADKARITSDVQGFTAVVTCSIGREGTDWPACSRVFNTVLDSNAVQPIQKLGRALRKSPGKKNVKMFNYIEHFPAWDSSPDVIREKLSDRFNAIIASSMLDDMLHPIMVPIAPKNRKDSSGTKGSAKEESATLDQIYGGARNGLVSDLMRGVLSLPDYEKTGKSIDDIIDRVMSDYEDGMLVDAPRNEVKSRLRKEVVRRLNATNPSLRMDGMNVDFIRENGWDKVVRQHIAGRSPFNGGADTRELAALQLFLKEQRNPDLKKRQLIDLAISGGEKPLSSTSLGIAMKNYMSPSNTAYDIEFSEKLRKIRPDWFLDIANSNRQRILELATSGAEKPHHATQLGVALNNYIRKNSTSYNKDFAVKIRKMRPDWFRATVANKRQILKLAMSGGEKPHKGTAIGSSLSCYVSPSSKSYDKSFSEKIRKLRPDWFANTSHSKKQAILDMAVDGHEKPHYKTPLGAALKNYLSPSNTAYDSDFSEKIRKLRPDWFSKKTMAI